MLWGTRGHWCNQQVVGTEHRQDAVIGLLTGNLDVGVERDTIAQLVPQPDNPVDEHAVAVFVDDVLIGYLPREVAPRYAAVLAGMVSSGTIPSVPIHLWARSYDDDDEQLDGSYVTVRRYYTRASVALAEPELVRPINLAPPRPRAELPTGPSVKVTRTQEHFEHLHAVLGDRARGWVYASLHRAESAGDRARKPIVEVRISGQPAGVFTRQMSETYLPLVEFLDAAGTTPVAGVLLEGSPISVVGRMHAVRPHELSSGWIAAATS
jgi:hypothetical protein